MLTTLKFSPNRKIIDTYTHIYRDTSTNLKIILPNGESKLIPDNYKRSFFAGKESPPPLYFNGEPIDFEKELKYLGIYLDSTLTWKRLIDYIIKKIYTAKNDLAYLLYSNEMSINNKILLYKKQYLDQYM